MASLQYDSMTPQAIVEEEEVERVKALLRRENLIRGLGIVDQLTRLLRSTEPKPVEVQRPHINVSECQVTLCTGLPSRGRAGHPRGPGGKLEAAGSWAGSFGICNPSSGQKFRIKSSHPMNGNPLLLLSACFYRQ